MIWEMNIIFSIELSSNWPKTVFKEEFHILVVLTSMQQSKPLADAAGENKIEQKFKIQYLGEYDITVPKSCAI